jgi:hypothetical protein
MLILALCAAERKTLTCLLPFPILKVKYENYDMQGTRRKMWPEVVGWIMGRNGAGHDKACHDHTSRCRKGNGKDA